MILVEDFALELLDFAPVGQAQWTIVTFLSSVVVWLFV